MIKTFGDKRTEAIFHGIISREVDRLPSEVVRSAVRKLDMLNAATQVLDLRSPPGNRLEALRGDLAGMYSIRVNDRWRLIFKWEQGSVWDVTLTDYHV